MSTPTNDRQLYPLRSSFGGGSNGEVLVDPWAVNLLADDMAASNPWAYSIAITEGPPPQMFTGGSSDLPLFCSSGLDPQLLLHLPALTRHYVAAEPSMAIVQSIFEASSTDPYAAYASDGLEAARSRMKLWASGTTTSGVDLIREQMDARDVQANQQRQINEAYANGGAAASNKAIREFKAHRAVQQAAADKGYQQALDSMRLVRTERGQLVPGEPGR